MKRTATALIMTVLVTAPAIGQSNEEISKRLDAIEKRLDTLEAIPNVGTLLLEQVRKNLSKDQGTNGGKSGKSDMVEVEPDQPKFVARLISIKPGEKDLLGTPRYRITVEVTNESGRDADLINAHVVFIDRLGNSIVRLTWDKSRGIPAGKSVKMSGTYQDSIGDSFTRLAGLDPSLFEAKFDIYKIAYKRGEVVTLKKCTFCDF